jgi:phospholipid/cholesterol/gamma-HCH transport system ATP-binding protein
VLFQQGALFSSLTVMENLQFPVREYLDLSQDLLDELAVAKLDMVGLDASVLDKFPAELSGGMTKRAALARALALDPRILLYDEPTTGLDPVVAARINHLIRDLQSRLGLTSVVVTHDLQSAFYVADRLAFLYDGRIRFTGTPAEARASADPPFHEFLTAS